MLFLHLASRTEGITLAVDLPCLRVCAWARAGRAKARSRLVRNPSRRGSRTACGRQVTPIRASRWFGWSREAAAAPARRVLPSYENERSDMARAPHSAPLSMPRSHAHAALIAATWARSRRSRTRSVRERSWPTAALTSSNLGFPYWIRYGRPDIQRAPLRPLSGTHLEDLFSTRWTSRFSTVFRPVR